MKKSRRILSAAVALGLVALPLGQAGAEDIDLFVGAAGASANPNILIIIDNSANWNRNDQGWTDYLGQIAPFKQGQSELRALRRLIPELSDKVNIGLMFARGGPPDGGFVRYAVRTMTEANKAAFVDLIGDQNCVDGTAENGTPRCIFKNFSGAEQTATSKTDYSAILFDAFKYFGGCTSPAYAQSGVCKTNISRTQFGVPRYSGNDPLSSADAVYYDKAAYESNMVRFIPPAGTADSCAKNYIVFIGNGFPTQNLDGSFLTGIEGNTNQLPMPLFSTTTDTQKSIIGTACGTGNNASQRKSDCESKISQSLKDAFPADSYACVAERNDQTACPGTNNRQFDIEATKTLITVTPTGTTALPGTNKARFADEWAQYLFQTDVSEAAGQQNVKVYTLDVFKDKQDVDQTALLASMAKYGGGKYHPATSEEAILNALREILIDIQSVNTVFASASLPINATNRSQNENQVFIGMFRPDSGAKPRWYGNLKRYQIGLFSGEAKLADADMKEAVSIETGFINACARSFWTTDSGEYWRFSNGAGMCTTAGTSLYSDSPDGSMVEKGATAEVVRRGNNPPSTDTTPTDTVNRTLYSCWSPWNGGCAGYANGMYPFTGENVWIGGVVPWWQGVTITTEEHERIINFTRGVDTEDENNSGGTFDTRPSLHGDVAHSRPLPVNYGGERGVVLFYGGNEGFFHAVRGSDGKELWAFVAPEHHPKLRRLQRNEPLVLYPNMQSPLPTPTPIRKDYFFDGSAGLFQNVDNTKVWVFPTMRRGGRMLHSFDVTNPSAPILKWRKGCWTTPYVPYYSWNTGETLTSDNYLCTPGFENMGQTWSVPSVALVKGFSEDRNRPVLITGGGYDECEDTDAKTSTCPASPKGSNVYVLNGDTGAIVKTFGTGGTGTIERSVASDVTLVDRDFDGYADHGYFVDTGGALYRIDFVDESLAKLAPENWKLSKLAYTTGAGRKFLFAPAALASAGKVYLTFGSGDRERPLRVNYPYVEEVQNRFYMFIDTFAQPVAPATTVAAVNLDSSELDNFTETNSMGCNVQMSVGSKGWFLDLKEGRGEQTVTSSTIFGGLVYFSTNYPEEEQEGVCRTELGVANGYAVNLLNASGAVGTEGLCGGERSAEFAGGGLPPSPVTGTVPVNGVPITVMIGGVNRANPAQSAPIGAQRVRPTIAQKRSRIYWYQKGDE